MKHLYEALLLSVHGIGGLRLKKILERFGDAENFWRASRQELQESRTLGIKELGAFLDLREKTDVGKFEKTWAALGIGICSQEDAEYPVLLNRIFDPPHLLFYRGCLSRDAFYFAVVGSRHSTSYGRAVARQFSEKLAKNGVTIVSGAARGIDTSAHEGALASGASTIAVLGCGVDRAYPAENVHLLEKITENGCVISEYLPGTPPNPGRFPERNRIVAGMSVGVMVVEAALKSGALITADLALNENREVYAIPGSVFSEASQGTNRLIQQGARLVGSPDELLEEWGMMSRVDALRTIQPLGAQEKKIWQAIEPGQFASLDQLMMQTGMIISELQVILLQMELAGYLTKDPIRGYGKVAKE